MLRDNFVCGYRDISDQSYAGVSGLHKPNGQAINTTNGAGPHNLQLFIMSADGVVLTCLPGYWNSTDLVREMKLAAQLDEVWRNPSLTSSQKDAMFRQMHLAHIQQHPADMVFRSKMQGFDQKFEAKNRLYASDCIRNPSLIGDPNAKMLPQEAFKTTDQIMHERMAVRPFRPYSRFDVAVYTDYGRPVYDKHEDYRYANGQLMPNRDPKSEPKIGNVQSLKRNRRQTANRNNGWNGVRYYGNTVGRAAFRNAVRAAYGQ